MVPFQVTVDDIHPIINCLWDQSLLDATTDPWEVRRNTSHIRYICLPPSSEETQVSIIYHLDTCPHPALYFPTLHHHSRPPHPSLRLSSCIPEFKVTFPTTLSKTAIWVPILITLPCFTFLQHTSIKHLFLSFSTVYFPHKNVNWWKLQEGKDCLLLYPQWPTSTCLVCIKYSTDISCINKWEVSNNFFHVYIF